MSFQTFHLGGLGRGDVDEVKNRMRQRALSYKKDSILITWDGILILNLQFENKPVLILSASSF